MYLFAEGIVVDFCMKVDNEKVQEFLDKWYLEQRDDMRHFSREDQMQIEQEHPLTIQADFEICCNGKAVLGNHHGMGRAWNACTNEAYDDEMLDIMEHYHLDKKESWAFWRESFELEAGQSNHLENVEIIIKGQKKQQNIGQFCLNDIGEQYHFVNPLTGIEHVIEALNFEQKILSDSSFPHNDMLYPMKYIVMEYRMTPPMNQKSYYIQDTSAGDLARKREMHLNENQNSDSSVIGFSASAVTVITGTSKQTENDQPCCVVCSSLHFDFTDEVEWRIIVVDENVEKIAVEIDMSEMN